jgi:hypothetical protein
MDVDLEKNVFTEWLLNWKKKAEDFADIAGTYYVPSRKALEVFCERFGTTPEFLKGFIVKSGKRMLSAPTRQSLISNALMGQWKSEWVFRTSEGRDFSYLRDLQEVTEIGVSVSNGVIIPFVGSPVEYGEAIIQYINGIILPGEVAKMLRREISGFNQTESNPFWQFAGIDDCIPDTDYLPELYEKLGVKGFEDLPKEVVKILVFYRNKMPYVDSNRFTQTRYKVNREIIYVVDRYVSPGSEYSDCYMLDKLPENTIKEARSYLENLKGVMPTEKWNPDIMELIISRGIKGKDLISLCRSSSKINKHCDEKLFTRLILSEFGHKLSYEYIQLLGFKTMREYYTQLHKFYAVASILKGVLKMGKEISRLRVDPVKNGEEEERRIGVLKRIYFITPEPYPEPKYPGIATYFLFKNEEKLVLSFLCIFEGSTHTNTKKFYHTNPLYNSFGEREVNGLLKIAEQNANISALFFAPLIVTLGGTQYTYTIYSSQN